MSKQIHPVLVCSVDQTVYSAGHNIPLFFSHKTQIERFFLSHILSFFYRCLQVIKTISRQNDLFTRMSVSKLFYFSTMMATFEEVMKIHLLFKIKILKLQIVRMLTNYVDYFFQLN